MVEGSQGSKKTLKYQAWVTNSDDTIEKELGKCGVVAGLGGRERLLRRRI